MRGVDREEFDGVTLLGRVPRDASFFPVGAAPRIAYGEIGIAMFSGRGKLLRIALLFVALVILGVVQWETQKAKRAGPLSGAVRVLVVPRTTETKTCDDWRVDVYLENSTNYELKLNGFTVHTAFDGKDEETAKRGTLSTKSNNPIWKLSKAKQTRIWHADNGCSQWAGHGNWKNQPTQIRYRVTAYTSDGIFSSTADTTVAIANRP